MDAKFSHSQKPKDHSRESTCSADNNTHRRSQPENSGLVCGSNWTSEICPLGGCGPSLWTSSRFGCTPPHPPQKPKPEKSRLSLAAAPKKTEKSRLLQDVQLLRMWAYDEVGVWIPLLDGIRGWDVSVGESSFSSYQAAMEENSVGLRQKLHQLCQSVSWASRSSWCSPAPSPPLPSFLYVLLQVLYGVSAAPHGGNYTQLQGRKLKTNRELTLCRALPPRADFLLKLRICSLFSAFRELSFIVWPEFIILT